MTTVNRAKFKEIEDVEVSIISIDFKIDAFDIRMKEICDDFQKDIDKDTEGTKKTIDIAFNKIVDLVNKRSEDVVNLGNAKVMLNQLIDLIKEDPDFTDELSDLKELKSRIETLNDDSTKNERQKKMADIGEVPASTKEAGFFGKILDQFAPKK